MNELFLNTLIIGLAIAAVIFTSATAYAVIVFTVDRIKWRHAKPLSIRVKSAHTERQYFTRLIVCAMTSCICASVMTKETSHGGQ